MMFLNIEETNEKQNMKSSPASGMRQTFGITLRQKLVMLAKLKYVFQSGKKNAKKVVAVGK